MPNEGSHHRYAKHLKKLKQWGRQYNRKMTQEKAIHWKEELDFTVDSYLTNNKPIKIKYDNNYLSTGYLHQLSRRKTHHQETTDKTYHYEEY